MVENHDSSIPSREDALQMLVGLLTSEIGERGWTLSVYTSRKGRRWASIKSFEPTAISSSVELDPADGDFMMASAILLALKEHITKHATGELVADYWRAAPHPIELVLETWRWLERQVEIARKEVIPDDTERQATDKQTK